MTLEASQIVLRPVISEKSMDNTRANKYTFAVHEDANKLQIKAAVEELFKVTVVDVNVLTNKPKEKSRNRRRGRVQAGHRPGRRPWSRSGPTTRSNSSRGCRRCRCEATSQPPRASGS